jgi:hypothetical protein
MRRRSELNLLLSAAISRVESVLETIRFLLGSEFPYSDSKVALNKIETLFKDKLNRLNSLPPGADPDYVKLQCATSLNACFVYLPLLGFILRSTNIRNAFELFGPLLEISGAALEPGVEKSKRKTQLLLSSEWNYSPITYHEIPDLPSFVLIGFPASESSNPLLVPLSGHELGHSMWADRKMELQFRPIIQRAIIDYINGHWADYQSLFPNVDDPSRLATDLFALETWSRALNWAVQQAKESFCDFIGIRIYGPSFLKAFAYLFAPNVHSPRSESYPQSMKRVRNLIRAAETYGFDVPSGYEGMFKPRPEPQLAPADGYRLRMADEVLDIVINGLIAKANDLISETNIQKPNLAEVKRIRKQLGLMVPAQHCTSLSNILNAAWEAYEDRNLWKPTLKEPGRKKEQILKDLVLKNIEIFEVEQILLLGGHQ